MSAPTPEPGAGETPCAECGWPKSDVWHDEEKRPRLGLPYHPFARALATPSPAAQPEEGPASHLCPECGTHLMYYRTPIPCPEGKPGCLALHFGLAFCPRCNPVAAPPRATPDLDALLEKVKALVEYARRRYSEDDFLSASESDAIGDLLDEVPSLVAALLDRVTRETEQADHWHSMYAGQLASNRAVIDRSREMLGGAEHELAALREQLARVEEEREALARDVTTAVHQINERNAAITVLRSQVERGEQAIAAWQDFASHQEWCRSCAEDGVDSCSEGKALRDAARSSHPVEPT